MADGIQFPDYYAQANDRAMAQQKLAQQMMVTKGLQFEQAQQQQTAQRASQFMQQMQAIPEGANWADKINAAAQSAIKTGDYPDADKIIGFWSKAQEQQEKAAKEGAEAAAKVVETRAKKAAQVAGALDGVQSQQDLDYRRAIYKQQTGEDLPPELTRFQPGMDKTIRDMSTTALQKADILLKTAQAKADQQKADAETMKAKAQAYKDNEEAKTQESVRVKNTKEAGKFEAEAEKDRALAASGGSAAGGAINFRYNNAQTGASNEVATEIENWQKLDPTGVSSAFTGIMKPGSSTSDSTRAFMARKMTPTETQVLGTTFGGMAKSVATMSNQGRPVTAPVLAAIEKSIIPVQGDDGATVMAKGARMRQYMENNIRDLKMSNATPAQLQQAQENLEKAQKYLPTWDQVIAATPVNKRAAIARQAKATDEAIAKEKAVAPVSISTDEEFNALPSGAEFIAPDGSHRKKP